MNRIFFVYQMSLELKINELLIKGFKFKDWTKILLTVKSKRTNIKSKLFDDYISFEKIYYSKNLFKIYNVSNRNNKKLNKLKIIKKDFLISPPIFDLTNLLLFDFFKKKGASVIIYSLNGFQYDKNKFRLMIKKSFFYSLNTYILSRKIIKIYNLKNTPHKYSILDISSDIHLDIGSLSDRKLFKSDKYFKIKSLIKNSKFSNKILLLVNTNKIKELTGLEVKEYFEKINHLIEHLRSNFKILIKDHPSSKYELDEINEYLKIDKKYIIDKKVSLENHLIDNDYKIVLSQGSNSLLFARIIGLKCYTLTNYFNSQKIDNFSEIYQFEKYSEGIDLLNLELSKNYQSEKDFFKLNRLLENKLAK